MISLQENKNKVLQDLRINLGLPNVNEGTYTRTLFDGLYKTTEEVLDTIQENYNSININTANESALEDYGESKGYPRLKANTISISKDSGDLLLTLELFKPNSGLILGVFKKGDRASTDIYNLTFIHDIQYDTGRLDNHVACIVTNREGFNLSNIILREGDRLDISVPEHLKSLVKSVYLTVKKERAFTRDIESLASYRKRLLYLGLASNTSSEESVNQVIRLAPGLKSYYIDKDSLPHNIVCITDGMYSNRLDKVFDKYTYPYLVNSLNHSRAYGQSYNISSATPIPFHINIITTRDDLFTQDVLIDLANQLANEHVLGYNFKVNEYVLERHIKTLIDEPLTFSVEFYYDYSGITVKTENPNEIELDKNEYPFIISCRVNSVFGV